MRMTTTLTAQENNMSDEEKKEEVEFTAIETKFETTGLCSVDDEVVEEKKEEEKEINKEEIKKEEDPVTDQPLHFDNKKTTDAPLPPVTTTEEAKRNIPDVAKIIQGPVFSMISFLSFAEPTFLNILSRKGLFSL